MAVPSAILGAMRREGYTASPEGQLLFRTGLDDEVFGVQVRPEVLHKGWHRLREISWETGLWPVVLGSPDRDDYARQLEETASCDADDPADLHELLRRAERLEPDPRAWAHEEHAKLVEAWRAKGREDVALRFTSVETREKEVCIDGAWPSDVKPPREPLPQNFARAEPYWVALVPARQRWEVPGLLRITHGLDIGMSTMRHVAIAKEWERRHGAALFSVGSHLAYWVERPPTTEDAARVLALEQFHYCRDLLYQGVEGIDTLPRLAAFLMNAQYWSFWWD